MAAIGKIREHGGFLTIIIGVALASFVIGPKALDLIFKSGPEFDRTSIAIVNGEKVDIDYFNSKVDEQVANFKQNQKKADLTQEERYTLTMQVWDQVKRETLLHQEELKIGLVKLNENNIPTISRAEYTDMIIGKNPHQVIVQNFTDQKTGKFNPEYVKNFLSNVQQGLNSENAKDREQAMTSDKQWKSLAAYIKEDRLTQKYNALIKQAYYTPTALAKYEYENRNSSITARYTAVRYNVIKDEDATPTDVDYNEYYAEHKNEFKQKEETRKIDYVVWNVQPSLKDIQGLEHDIQEIKAGLATIDMESVPSFVNSYRDSRYDSTWYKEGQLSPFIDSAAFASEVGTVLGPWTENNEYHVARIIAMQMRPDSMRASHILISYSGAYNAPETITRTKISARAIADSLLELAKTGDFSALALENSDDPTAKTNSGDLNWFADGQMVPEFNQACIDHKVNDVIVVETAFGFHILKVTGKKDVMKKIRLGQINLRIKFSKETHNKAFTDATHFASSVSDATSFDSVSTNLQLNVMKGNYIKEMEASIMGVPGSRSIVQWMFNKKTTKGSISDVFDFDNRIVVAILSDVRPAGISPLEDVKEYIQPLVVREVKAKQLIAKLGSASDINKFAANNKVAVDTINPFTFAAYSLPKYGPEHNVQGHMFGTDIAMVKGPIKGDQGVYVFVVDATKPAPENKVGYRFTRDAVKRTFAQMADQGAYNAIDEAAKITDYRKFVY